MSEIQQNRYDQLIRRVGGIIGPGSKVSEVISELFPMIDVENVPGELLFLMGTKLAHGGGQQTGAAGEFAQVNLRNPAGSGHLITITTVVFVGTAALTFNTSAGTEVVQTSANSAALRDVRTGADQPVGIVDIDSNVAAVAAINRFSILANQPMVLKDPNGVAVLGPGDMYQVGTNVAAQTILVTYFWRERVAESSELLFSG